MKKLFIYYSLTGNVKYVAECLEKKGIELREVKSKEKMPNNNFLRILKGGFLASINHQADIEPLDINIRKYKEIIIGSPVWNDNFPPAINTVLNTLLLTEKKVSFILSSGGGKAPKLTNKINKLYSKSKIIVLKNPLKNKEELNSILENI